MMKKTNLRRVAPALALATAALLMSACGSSADKPADTTVAAAAETTPAETTPAETTPAETTAPASADTTAAAAAETTAAAAETTVAAAAGAEDIVAEAKAFVDGQLTGSGGFEGPKEGPKAAAGKKIVYVASDLTNGGVTAVAEGVKEAVTAIGWTVEVLDGKATAQGRTDALNAAIASKPDGIILGGFDAVEQKTAIAQATDQKIPVVGWHAGATPGPIPEAGLFTNVTTDPLEVSKIAAFYAIADSNGTAGVVIFTDTQYEIAVKKADTMRDIIKKCPGCSVLSYENSPIAEADSKMPPLVASLLQKHGDKLTYMLAINGNYYGGSRQALKDAGKDPAGPPKQIAAGDGDAAEFKRIREGDYQTATVAEPLFLQGWQLVDEVNRALNGAPASGYLAPPGLVVKANVGSGDVFDPAAKYRDNFKAIWGK
jgi:ribose transport system substrate-binding protein